MRPRDREGFTLVEIIVALAVVSILAAALSPLVVRYIQDARETRTINDMQSISTAYVQYFADNGVWPCNWNSARASQAQLAAQTCFHVAPRALTSWNGPYLKNGVRQGAEMRVARPPRGNSAGEGVLDGWGRPFSVVYQNPTPRIAGADGGVIVLISGGPDGRVRTSRRQAVEGTAVGDDIVHVITRKTS